MYAAGGVARWMASLVAYSTNAWMSLFFQVNNGNNGPNAGLAQIQQPKPNRPINTVEISILYYNTLLEASDYAVQLEDDIQDLRNKMDVNEALVKMGQDSTKFKMDNNAFWTLLVTPNNPATETTSVSITNTVALIQSLQKTKKLIDEKLESLLNQVTTELSTDSASESSDSKYVCAVCDESLCVSTPIKFTLACPKAHQICDSCYKQYKDYGIIKDSDNGTIIEACPACPYQKHLNLLEHKGL